MTVSSERLADVDAQLESLGVSEERISEVRARVADGFSPDLASVDESLNELSADLEGLDGILAEARANVPAVEPAAPAEEATLDEEIVVESSESDIEELDIEDFDMDDVEEVVIDGDSESPEAAAESSLDEPMPIDDAHPEGESESPFDEPLPEQSLQDESQAETAKAAETVEEEASASLSAQDLFDAAMDDDSEMPPKRDSEAPAAMDDLAHMLDEEVSSSGDQEAPEEESEGSSDIDALLDGGDEIEVMAEPSALVDLASLEVDEGDAMVEIGAVLDEEATDDAEASSEGAEGDGDDDPDGEGDKKGFFKKLFG